MWNIIIGIIVLYVAYNAKQINHYPDFFVPAGLVLGILNIGIGIMTILG